MNGLQSFKEWMRGAGVQWDESLMEIRDCSVGKLQPGWGVFAVKDLKEGDRLCCIPKSAVLSTVTSSISGVLEAERLRGGLALTLAVAVEKAKGEGSLWWGYFQSIPKREYLPIFWTDKELSGLQGTDVEGKPQEDKDLTGEDFNALVAPVLETYDELKGLNISLQMFREAASLVASRAFFVDKEHGQAMVPLADVFNHKASMVALSDEYQIEGYSSSESDSENEEEGGSPDGVSGVPCNEAASSPESRGFIDGVQGHTDASSSEGGTRATTPSSRIPRSTIRPAVHGSSRPIDPALQLEIGICSTVTNGNESVLEIIVASPIQAKQEIHNTYGEHSNSELLSKYGFALATNPFNCLCLSKSVLLEKAGESLGKQDMSRRLRFMRKHSCLLNEEDEPFEIFSAGRISPAVTAAVRILTARKHVYRGWQSIEDVRNSDMEAFSSIMPLRSVESILGIDGLMCLKKVLEERNAAYFSKDVQEDRLWLSSLEESSCWSDGISALVGACVLRISEREILEEMIQSINGGVQRLLMTGMSTQDSSTRSTKRKVASEAGVVGDWRVQQRQLYLGVD